MRFVCGGLVMALSWWLFGLLAIRTIVDIPWAKACFVIGQFACWLAGKEAVSRDTHNSQAGSGGGIAGHWPLDRGGLLVLNPHWHTVWPSALQARGYCAGPHWQHNGDHQIAQQTAAFRQLRGKPPTSRPLLFQA